MTICNPVINNIVAWTEICQFRVAYLRFHPFLTVFGWCSSRKFCNLLRIKNELFWFCWVRKKNPRLFTISKVVLLPICDYKLNESKWTETILKCLSELHVRFNLHWPWKKHGIEQAYKRIVSEKYGFLVIFFEWSVQRLQDRVKYSRYSTTAICVFYADWVCQSNCIW